MNQLPLRGVIGPGFIALAIAAGLVELWLDSRNPGWLSLGFLTLGLAFGRDTRRLIASAAGKLRAHSVD
jgi:hypothetical protein